MKDSLQSFTMEYTPRVNAAPGCDIQFGMDFKLTHKQGYALCQLIFPATSVGKNIKGKWNIDNIESPGGVDSLIFVNAGKGTIVDIPTELSKPDMGVMSTKFAVFPVDIKNATINVHGVTFGYSINTSDSKPKVIYSKMKLVKLSTEQKKEIERKCSFIKYVNLEETK